MIWTYLLAGIVLSAPQTAGPPAAANLLELTPEIRSFVDQKVDRTLLPMPRLEALVTAVFQDSALGFGYAPETRSAAETFTSRSGNCLSFTILFIAGLISPDVSTTKCCLFILSTVGSIFS